MSGAALMLAALAGLLGWLYLAFARSGFWRADQRLSKTTPQPDIWPPVVAIIPARNEAVLIGKSLLSVASQNYPGAFRVLLVDDSSEDATAAIARSLETPIPVEVVTAPPLEKGWTGKLWALNQGVEAARADRPGEGEPFLWFTDADIVHGPEVLKALVSKALSEHLDMVSLMALLNCRNLCGRWFLPAFVFFFQKLYPFRAVNRSHSRLAAAAGGCILLKDEMLEKAGGLEAIRGQLIDDCSLARRIKDAGGRLWLGLAEESWSMRSYAFPVFWRMVSRTAYTQLRYSPLLLAGTVVGMSLLYLAPPLLALTLPIHGDGLAAGLGGLSWLVMAALYRPTLAYYKRPAIEGLLLPVIGAVYTLITLSSALGHWLGRGSRWKERSYPR